MFEDLIKIRVADVKVAVPAGNGVEAGLVVLEEEDYPHRSLRMFIGQPEARAIHGPWSNAVPPRPSTWDLFVSTISLLDGRIERVVITDVEELRHFFAQLVLVYQGNDDTPLLVTARPSDALALALRAYGAGIYAEPHVLDAAGVLADGTTWVRPEPDDDETGEEDGNEGDDDEDDGEGDDDDGDDDEEGDEDDDDRDDDEEEEDGGNDGDGEDDGDGEEDSEDEDDEDVHDEDEPGVTSTAGVEPATAAASDWGAEALGSFGGDAASEPVADSVTTGTDGGVQPVERVPDGHIEPAWRRRGQSVDPAEAARAPRLASVPPSPEEAANPPASTPEVTVVGTSPEAANPPAPTPEAANPPAPTPEAANPPASTPEVTVVGTGPVPTGEEAAPPAGEEADRKKVKKKKKKKKAANKEAGKKGKAGGSHSTDS